MVPGKAAGPADAEEDMALSKVVDVGPAEVEDVEDSAEDAEDDVENAAEDVVAGVVPDMVPDMVPEVGPGPPLLSPCSPLSLSCAIRP